MMNSNNVLNTKGSEKMYIAVKERQNKYNDRVFYLYLSESKRIDGKVQNKQKYLTSVREIDFKNGSYVDVFKQKLNHLTEDEREVLEDKVKKIMSQL
jgi:hypothetical protein